MHIYTHIYKKDNNNDNNNNNSNNDDLQKDQHGKKQKRGLNKKLAI